MRNNLVSIIVDEIKDTGLKVAQNIIIIRLFEVDKSAIHTPQRSKEMQDMAHLPNNYSLLGAMETQLSIIKKITMGGS